MSDLIENPEDWFSHVASHFGSIVFFVIDTIIKLDWNPEQILLAMQVP